MSKQFRCRECGCNSVAIMREVVEFNHVEIDAEGNILYREDLEAEPVLEEYTPYICAECGKYLSIDGVIVTAEKELQKYLEEYGVEAQADAVNKKLQDVTNK